MSTDPITPTGPAAVLSSNPILDDLLQILDPRDEIELVTFEGETIRLRTVIPARRSINAIRAMETMLARPEVAPVAGVVRDFLSKAMAGKADGDVMRTIVSMVGQVPAALEIVLNDVDAILKDAYGDKLRQPASEHLELGEVFKAMVPFFSRPLRALLPARQTAGAANSATSTTTGA